MLGDGAIDRRQTARIPAGARLLHRAVGMSDYALCEVLNVTTSAMELLLERPLETGTVVTILVRPEGSPRKYYRVVGSVERRAPRGSRWLHVIRASTKRPWSPMFIYDVMHQALSGPKPRPAPEWMFVDDAAAARPDPGNEYSKLIEALERTAPDRGAAEARRAGPDRGDPYVYRALAWFAPFHALNDLLRQFIASEQPVTSEAAGTTLVERGSLDDISICLVEGTVEVEAYDGKKSIIAAGTRDAQFPISVLRPHAYTVRAVTDVTVIQLSQDIVRKVARITAAHKGRPGIEVSEGGSPPEAASDA